MGTFWARTSLNTVWWVRNALIIGFPRGWPPGHPRGTLGNTRGMVHFWQFFGRAGWGHCLALKMNASDPRDAPPGFGRHWSAVHGFQNPRWRACLHLYSISWICCTLFLHHAIVQSLGCFSKKKEVCYWRQFWWICCARWAKFHFVRFRRFWTYIFNILKPACASYNKL